MRAKAYEDRFMRMVQKKTRGIHGLGRLARAPNLLHF